MLGGQAVLEGSAVEGERCVQEERGRVPGGVDLLRRPWNEVGRSPMVRPGSPALPAFVGRIGLARDVAPARAGAREQQEGEHREALHRRERTTGAPREEVCARARDPVLVRAIAARPAGAAGDGSAGA